MEALSTVISRQKEIADTIGNEVDLQNGKILLMAMLILVSLGFCLLAVMSKALLSLVVGNGDSGCQWGLAP